MDRNRLVEEQCKLNSQIRHLKEDAAKKSAKRERERQQMLQHVDQLGSMLRGSDEPQTTGTPVTPNGGRRQSEESSSNNNSGESASMLVDRHDNRATSNGNNAQNAKAKKLIDTIDKSKDKVFVITVPPDYRGREGYKLHSWHVVRVMEEDNDWEESVKSGRFHVRFLIPCVHDVDKKDVSECRYWPEIHGLKDGKMAWVVPSSPSKAAKQLKSAPEKYVWYQATIPLLEWMIAGPFEFEAPYKVPKAVWKRLEKAAEERKVYIGNLRTKRLLDNLHDQV